MTKTLIGPKLRQLRGLHNHTQAEMAKRLGVSAAYVNLLENNQRSLSVQVLMALSEAYGVDAKSLVQGNEATRLTELRAAVKDPVFTGDLPDLTELRAALDHAPRLVDRFLELHRDYRTLADHLQRSVAAGASGEVLRAAPEREIYDFFRTRQNHFPALEEMAQISRERLGGTQDDMYALLKRHLRVTHGIQSDLRRLTEMPDALMEFDEKAAEVHLSEALDQPNRNFQLAHVVAQIEAGEVVQGLVASAGLRSDTGRKRLEVELLNYVAAAILLPYAPFLALARESGYDLDRLAAAFGVSFEQVCHRLTTLQDPADRGIPFFFLRVDRAGNVTKRFNATGAQLADQGGGCPVWNIHGAFHQPSVIQPQFVELPDGARYFTLSRTSDRPVFSRTTQDRRLVVALGCDARHAEEITYARSLNAKDPALYAQVGLNCHTCPRQKCAQRAHQPLHMTLKVDSHRRGRTRYES
ncbi:helix-turn-helix domain-containing protein [Maliponia aquimaris]|uniref:Helix-turn-helix protein n=1 Tax=Maliponia aquimaris TaxID=1673631 RepID=A0A238L5T7_9RHOB|nr:short-chain fatty acyl-CoA regulator family protein [Maliponia aquimaris]SMX50171.1 helix-turn-helix protein [Maliponia aquimaris]